MIAASATLGDSELGAAVDELVAINVPYESGTESPVADLDRGFRAVINRLAELRRATFVDV